MNRLPLLACLVLLLTPSFAAPKALSEAQLDKEGQAQLSWDERSPIITQGTILRVESLTDPGVYLDIPLSELRLVHPYARQSALGVRIGALARVYGRQRPANRRFWRNGRIACAAFVSYVLKKAGWRHGSPSVRALYGQTRRYGGRVVAVRVSTRHTAWFPLYKAGDLIFFHRGGRLGHVEIYLGGGLVAGTSSSVGRVGIRRISARGFSQMTIIRL